MEVDGIPLNRMFPCAELTQKLPGKGISRKTVERWRSRGVRTAKGVVVLRTCRLGTGAYLTCDEWLNEFLRAIVHVPTTESTTVPSKPGRKRIDTRRARSGKVADAREKLAGKWE